MNKNIIELETSEEKKILISKIEKKITFLADKTQVFFEKSISVSPKKIKNAFSNNENLILILEQNKELVNLINVESYEIRENHQTNFTKEIELNIKDEIKDISIIQNTLEYRGKIIRSSEKMNVFNKRLKYLENRNKKRETEMLNSERKILTKIKDNKILDIKPMEEDIKLIFSYIDPKEIDRSRFIFLAPIFIFLFSIMVVGVFVWAVQTF